MKQTDEELLNKIGLLAMKDSQGETILAFNIRLYSSKMILTQESLIEETGEILDQLILIKESLVRTAQDIIGIVVKETMGQFSAEVMYNVLQEYTKAELVSEQITKIYSGISPTKICLCYDNYYLIEIVLATTLDKPLLAQPTIH